MAANSRIKVLYIQQNTKSFAGVEHVLHTICSEISRKFGTSIELDVLYTSEHENRPKTRPAYNEITRISRNTLHMMQICRRTVASKDYQLVVVPQIEPTVLVMIACLGISRRIAVYLHGNPHRERSHWKAKVLFFLMKFYFLRRVSDVFGTSPRQLESFRKMFGSEVRQTWLPNPVRRFDDQSNCAIDQDFVTFVNVGRFTHQKGQDILISAFSELVRTRKNVRLRVVGYGEDEAALRQQVLQLNLQSVVTFDNFPGNPAPALSASDVFVSTSRWEGWSLAICEALRFGLPVVSIDCQFGPSDILTDEKLGRLVQPDKIDQLVDAMAYYVDNLRYEKTHSDYRKAYVARFDVDQVVDVHAAAILTAAGRAPVGIGDILAF
ncbi:glycosyltransferase [Rhizobium tumorigenes]|uniref:Glycosyltransferase n=1 Tax=Rhizobium tumorigenes TaxID=2041385 RepID=A0AAF1KTU8_9HYPH|nr:glycosyltransferase [Rhizobium tumorigenes]WFR97660.1 glycosyltransferase [Rhizobium tumorigenes]